jgi:tripartite-type tricarboxylate transporter receptor subunit TctC
MALELRMGFTHIKGAVMKRGVAGRSIGLLVGLVGLAFAPAAHAQADAGHYPNKPVHILVGFGPGGGMDLLARIVGQKLSERLGQPVIIDNKPGAGAMLAAELLARAPADGYTLLVAPNSTFVINPAVYTKLAYSPRDDFAPIVQLAKMPCVLVVSAGSPVRSVPDLIAYAKAHPDKANAAGSSASFQLATALFNSKSGAPLTYVGYKSTSEAVTAIVGGEILAALLDSPPVAPQMDAGALRALAVASSRREPLFPGVPTLEEAGIRGAEINLWGGLFAPAHTPADVVARLEKDAIAVVKQPDVQERLRALKTEPGGDLASTEFSAFIASEMARWTTIAKAANIKIEP